MILNIQKITVMFIQEFKPVDPNVEFPDWRIFEVSTAGDKP